MAQEMETAGNRDAVVPHRLCNFCADVVSRAECLRHNRQDLLSVDFKPYAKADPVQYYIDDAYPSIRAIARSHKRGCHLCSIIISSILVRNSYARAKEIFDAQGDVGSAIHAMLTLETFNQDADTVFMLTLHKTRPQDGDSWHSRISQESIVLRRVRNEDVWSCQVCEHCLDKQKSPPGPLEASSQQAHYRWTEYTGSDVSIQMIQGWLNYCLAGHAECNVSSTSARPTRLLDLAGLHAQGDIRIVPGSEVQKKAYATLSYRWGTENPFLLTRSNLETFCQWIEFASLPKTFKDAVIVCRGLGIPYLWIDALCIVQGVDGDWDAEASRMGSVYAGSTLTLAAAYAERGRGGFLQHRSPLGQQDCRILRDGTHTVLARAFPFCYYSRHIPGKSRLDTRGWVLQERLLSPRTLYFGPDGVHWECRVGLVCENRPNFDGPDPFHPELRIKDVYKALNDLKSIPNWSNGQSSWQFLQCWNTVLDAYSRTTLSRDGDKLVAVAGITSIFQTLGVQASFGLWLPIFATELLWGTYEKVIGREKLSSRRRHDFAPSWSWASISGATIHNRAHPYAKGFRMDQAVTATVERLPFPTAFTRADILPQPEGPQYAVRVRGMLRQCLATCRWREDGVWDTIYTASNGDDVDTSGEDFIVDVPLPAPVPLYCLHVARFQVEDKYYPSRTDLGLVLTPVDVSRNLYRRVGLYEAVTTQRDSDVKMFALSVPESVIEII